MLLTTLAAGCGAPVEDANQDDADSINATSELGQARPLGLPPPCLVCAPRTLASGSQMLVTGLAVTGSAVFWSGGVGSAGSVQTGIYSVPLYGGSPTLFSDASPSIPNSLVAAGGSVYWKDGVNSAGPWVISEAGGTATELGTTGYPIERQQTQGLAVRVTHGALLSLPLQFNTVVSGDPDLSHLWKFANSTLLPKQTTTTLLDANAGDSPENFLYYPDNVTLDGANAYFVSDRAETNPVYQMSLGGGTPQSIGWAVLQSPIAVYGNNVYFSTGTAIATVPVGGGSTQAAFVTDNVPATTFAIDGSNLYWTCTTCGTVCKHSFTGGETTVIASHESAPKFLAVDSSYVYWSTSSAGGNAAIRAFTK
ncbi:MAG TPA: hypothetical protein VMI54_19905 [Polyangiaceae bacterium]|nr:hypothetical protein [Polyangiaceae bacterium]